MWLCKSKLNTLKTSGISVKLFVGIGRELIWLPLLQAVKKKKKSDIWPCQVTYTADVRSSTTYCITLHNSITEDVSINLLQHPTNDIVRFQIQPLYSRKQAKCPFAFLNNMFLVTLARYKSDREHQANQGPYHTVASCHLTANQPFQMILVYWLIWHMLLCQMLKSLTRLRLIILLYKVHFASSNKIIKSIAKLS